MLECGDVVVVTLPTSIPRGHDCTFNYPGWFLGIQQKDLVRYAVANAPYVSVQNSNRIAIDQTRGLDINRIVAYLGTLTPEQYVPILDGLTQLFRQ